MKKPFFLSSISFTVAAILGFIITSFWLIPTEVYAQYTPPIANTLGIIQWILGILGIVAFVIGAWNKNWE